jgi:hypothetical protein
LALAVRRSNHSVKSYTFFVDFSQLVQFSLYQE